MILFTILVITILLIGFISHRPAAPLPHLQRRARAVPPGGAAAPRMAQPRGVWGV